MPKPYMIGPALLAPIGQPQATGVLVAPQQASSGRAGAVVQRLIDSGFIAQARFLDLGESMANGGGPACLRLRLSLSPRALAQMPANLLLDDTRITRLEGWVDRHYREVLSHRDLADPDLLTEWAAAMDDLHRLGW